MKMPMPFILGYKLILQIRLAPRIAPYLRFEGTRPGGFVAQLRNEVARSLLTGPALISPFHKSRRISGVAVPHLSHQHAKYYVVQRIA